MFDSKVSGCTSVRPNRAVKGFAVFAMIAFASTSMTAHAAGTDEKEKPAAHHDHKAADHGSHKAMDGHAAKPMGDHSEIMHGDLTLVGAWIRQPPPTAPAVGGYLTITNNGDEVDRLLGGSADFAEKVEVHSMTMKDDVMIMREVDGGIEIAPGSTVELKPGGLHLMFMKISDHPTEGSMVPVTLEFEKAGPITLDLPVAGIGAKDAPGGHSHGAKPN